MKYKNYLFSIAFLALCSSLPAQQISVREAQSRAYDFLQKQEVKRASKRDGKVSNDLKLVFTRERTSDLRPLYYVFNFGQDEGYIIMGGDATAREVLAYSDHGSFDNERLAPAFRWWLGQFEQQISAAIDQGVAGQGDGSRAASRQAGIARKSIKPMLTTTWGQGVPYSNAINADLQQQCKTTNNYGIVTGCVATAMAQVMYYHQWPQQGTGSHSGVNRIAIGNNRIFVPQANFASTTYDWEKMLPHYLEGEYSNSQAQAVATLMYHVGVAVDMKYGKTSSASSYDIPTALSTYFGYDKSALYRYRDCYTDAQWEEMVYQELAQGRPVLYSGAQPSVGHQFVCCGYDADNDLYYFNWGWDGRSDDYCPLSGTKALTPVGTGTGGGVANTAYTLQQDIIVNVKPDEGGTESPSVVQYDYYTSNDFVLLDGSQAISNYNYTNKVSKSLSLKTVVWNVSSTLTRLQFGVKATEKNSGITHYWSGSSVSLIKTGIATITTSFALNQLTSNGIYEISPVVRPSGATNVEDWVDVPVQNHYTLPTVTVTCGEALEARDITFRMESTEVQVNRHLWILHDETYDGEVIYTSSNPSVATVDAEGKVTGQKMGTAVITAQGAEMQFAGSKLFNATTASFEVTVTELIKQQAEASLKQTYLASGQTAQIEWNEGYDGKPQFSSSNTQVATVDAMGMVTGLSAGTTIIKAVLPATSCWCGTEAEFEVIVTSSTCFLTMTPYFDNDNNPHAGNPLLHVALCNAGSSDVTAYLICAIYELNGSQETYLGYTGFSIELKSNKQFEDVVELSDWDFVADKRYRIRFYQNTSRTTKWNVEYIDFTWRETLEIPYSITTAGIGTLILPFDAMVPSRDNDGNSIKWKVYACQSLEETGDLNLIAVTQLKRNTPYILVGDMANYTFRGPNVIEASQYSDGLLTGALRDQEVAFQTGDYILQNHDGHVAFYRYDPEVATTNNGYCKPYRAFLRTRAFSEHLLLNIVEPEPEAIEDVIGDMRRPAGVYGLDGKMYNELQPGINIVVDTRGKTRKVYFE